MLKQMTQLILIMKHDILLIDSALAFYSTWNKEVMGTNKCMLSCCMLTILACTEVHK